MNKIRLLVTTGIVNIFECYDYALFGHFATIIGKKFFPVSDPNAALLKVFLIFAIGYLMRPIGGILFGIIGDRLGRRTALSAAVICMAFPTFAIGLLPTYDSIGIFATILIIVTRMLQGLSMGGTLTGSVSFIIEHTDSKHRGFMGSIPMSSICLGILLGSAVSYLTKSILSEDHFNDWGWRVPFIIGIFIFFTGVYIKRHTLETPLFEDIKNKHSVVHSPIKKVLSLYWFDMIVSIIINSTGSVIFYFEAIYLVQYFKHNRYFPEDDVNNLVNLCYTIMAIVTLFMGWLSDRLPRRTTIFVINLILIIVSFPILVNIFENGNFLSVTIAYISLAVIAATYIAPEPALQAEFYPTAIRNTALSVSYNFAASTFGALPHI